MDLAEGLARWGRRVDVFLHLVPAIVALILVLMAYNMAQDGSYLEDARSSKIREARVLP